MANNSQIIRLRSIADILHTYRYHEPLTRRKITHILTRAPYFLADFSTRTIGRDIDILMDDYGAPGIIYTPENGYALTDPAWEFPIESFSKEEVLSLMAVIQLITDTPTNKYIPALPSLRSLLRNMKARCSEDISDHPTNEDLEPLQGRLTDEEFGLWKEAMNHDGFDLYLKERYDEAIREATHSIKIWPTSGAYKARANAYLEIGNHEAALEDTSKIIELEHGHSFHWYEALILRAEIYESLDQYTEAINTLTTICTTAYEMHHRCAGLCKRARLHMKARKSKKAHEDYANALEIDDIYTLNARARTNIGLKQYNKAIDDYTTLIKINSQNEHRLNDRAKLHLRLGQYQKAINDATASLQICPDQAYPLNIKAGANFKLKQYEQAIEDATASLKVEPQQVWALNLRANSYQMMQRHTEAINDANASLKINPKQNAIYQVRETAICRLRQNNQSRNPTTEEFDEFSMDQIDFQ
jgi:tetratricopeptide (TPR) repeat protein